jgi:hypothetical protein
MDFLIFQLRLLIDFVFLAGLVFDFGPSIKARVTNAGMR